MRLPTKYQTIHLLILLAAPIIIGLIDYTIRQRALSPEVNIFLAFVALAAVVVFVGTMFYKQMNGLSWGQLFFRVFTFWLLFSILAACIYLISHNQTNVDYFELFEEGLIGEVQSRRWRPDFLFRRHCIGVLFATVFSILYEPKDYNAPSWNINLFFLWVIIIAIVMIFI